MLLQNKVISELPKSRPDYTLLTRSQFNRIHSTPLITIARGPEFFNRSLYPNIVIGENRYILASLPGP